MKKMFIGSHISKDCHDLIEAERTASKRTRSAEIYKLIEEALEHRAKDRTAKA